MPRTKPPSSTALNGHEVMTLAEAAAYLRASPEEVLHLVTTDDLPGRRVGGDWRFLKCALQAWLSKPAPAGSAFWERHFGALKGDPYAEEMLREIYNRRERPMTEEG
jgi:excisionase family DNA binding protein